MAMERFYVPIIVVGCKSEKLNFNDLGVLRQMKEIQGKLRLVCLEVGAALIFPSKEQELQKHQLLKSYITHRLFSEYVRMDLALEVIRLPFQTHRLN